MKDIVLSGIRPTGNLHLGNYYGAVRSFVKMQEEYNCYFFIADWHSLTTHPKPENIQRSARTILAEYLACGIDPEKATIYIQSDVPETIELYLYFNMNAYIGELGRVTTFKEKARQQPDNVNAGLFTYPTLMAADILQHRAKWVPVGKDQEQNMEMARKCARRFNNIYGIEFFPEPQNYYFGGDAIKVPGLDGSGKMGKSDGNCIYLYEDEKTVRKKVMRAVTDSGPQTPNSPKPEVIQNLFTMMSIVSAPETVKYSASASKSSLPTPTVSTASPVSVPKRPARVPPRPSMKFVKSSASALINFPFSVFSFPFPWATLSHTKKFPSAPF